MEKVSSQMPASETSTSQHRFPRLVTIAVLILIIGILLRFKSPLKPPMSPLSEQKLEMQKFTTDAEFKKYIEEAKTVGSYGLYELGRGIELQAPSFVEDQMMTQPGLPKAAGVPERVSEANVQVAGIDEPDIVKTDGTNIFLSQENQVFLQMMERQILPGEGMPVPFQSLGETKLISAFPIDTLKKITAIDKTGKLLLDRKTLLILSGNTIYGYSVADPKNPSQKWQLDLDQNREIMGARFYENKLYVLTKTYINTTPPCPMPLATIQNQKITVPCIEIYHPVKVVPADSTFTAMKINPDTGTIDTSVSFVGSAGLSVLYVSPQALYVTYIYPGDFVAFMYNFLIEKGKDLVSEEVINKLKKLQEYDLSDNAKQVEMMNILDRYESSLSDDERARHKNEMNNKLKAYEEVHMRELEQTGIVKVKLSSMNIESTGVVPGHPLNQFSLDEYNDHLRIATTVDGGFFSGGSESANDVYVLGNDLKIQGSVTNLGLGERIYSVRFMKDKGYVVTFKQVDPFYVLDLQDPGNPKKAGELKIPGYSSYLHEIADNVILGAGKEGQQVKLSLFDVSNPASPRELDKYTLDEYYSEILDTQYAFLQDSKHEVFFIPGGKGGYIFSYAGNKLALKKVVTEVHARRALYINDYLYILGDNKLVVVNESDWQAVKSLEY